jgi:glycosyltransferase involved in cell wall biosynthesis/thioredoxin-like negative regulator of GroEL
MSSESPDNGRRHLSVAMIVRNEEDVLPATIENVRPIADEIHVLDTGSTDRTLEVAQGLGARTGSVPWNDDFAGARNRLLGEISGDWVLWLDAGEGLSPDSAIELRKFIDREADPKKVYMLTVVVPSSNGDASDEQIAVARLMPNHPDLRFEGRVSETLQTSIRAAGLEIALAPGRIRRHGRVNDPDRKAERARRNLRLVDMENAAGSQSPRLFLARGEAHCDLGNIGAARDAFRRTIDIAARGSTPMLEGYYGLLTSYDGDEALRDEQLHVALEALEIYPLDAQLLCLMGSYLQGKGRLDLAERAFDTAVKYGQVDLESWHLAEIAEMAAICLNLSKQLQNKEQEALGIVQEALVRYPHSARIRRHLMDLYIKLGRSDDAVQTADSITVDPQERASLRNAVRGAVKATAKDWLQALGYLQTAYAAGCRDPLCLRWLTVALLSNGQTEAACPVLREWLQLQPDNAEALAYANVLGGQQEIVDAGGGSSADEANTGRRIRIDAATTVQDVVMPQIPLVESLSHSADTMADADF